MALAGAEAAERRQRLRQQ